METVHSAELAFNGNTVTAAAPKLVLLPQVNVAPLIDSRPQWPTTDSAFCCGKLRGPPGPVVKVILNWRQQLKAP